MSATSIFNAGQETLWGYDHGFSRIWPQTWLYALGLRFRIADVLQTCRSCTGSKNKGLWSASWVLSLHRWVFCEESAVPCILPVCSPNASPNCKHGLWPSALWQAFHSATQQSYGQEIHRRRCELVLLTCGLGQTESSEQFIFVRGKTKDKQTGMIPNPDLGVGSAYFLASQNISSL